MTQAEIQELMTDAGCLRFCASDKELLAMIAYLLWSQLHPGEDMTQEAVQELMNDVGCLRFCIGPKELMAAIVQLLFDGGGGAAGGFTFTTAAGLPPVDGSITTQGYINSDTAVKYVNVAWPDTASPDWQQF